MFLSNDKRKNPTDSPSGLFFCISPFFVKVSGPTSVHELLKSLYHYTFHMSTNFLHKSEGMRICIDFSPFKCYNVAKTENGGIFYDK